MQLGTGLLPAEWRSALAEGVAAAAAVEAAESEDEPEKGTSEDESY